LEIQTVNEIIRPIIVSSINRYSEQEFSISLQKLDKSSNDIFKEINDSLSSIKNSIEVVNDTLSKTELLLKIPAIATILKFISTRLNPIVATISAVVTIISSLFGKSKEEQEREEYQRMRDNIRNQTIPAIIIAIRPTIEDILKSTKKKFFKEVEDSINAQKEELIQSLEKAKEEKEKLLNNETTQTRDRKLLRTTIRKKAKQQIIIGDIGLQNYNVKSF